MEERYNALVSEERFVARSKDVQTSSISYYLAAICLLIFVCYSVCYYLPATMCLLLFACYSLPATLCLLTLSSTPNPSPSPSLKPGTVIFTVTVAVRTLTASTELVLC